jgi:hypothetical protein
MAPYIIRRQVGRRPARNSRKAPAPYFPLWSASRQAGRSRRISFSFVLRPEINGTEPVNAALKPAQPPAGWGVRAPVPYAGCCAVVGPISDVWLAPGGLGSTRSKGKEMNPAGSTRPCISRRRQCTGNRCGEFLPRLGVHSKAAKGFASTRREALGGYLGSTRRSERTTPAEVDPPVHGGVILQTRPCQGTHEKAPPCV